MFKLIIWKEGNKTKVLALVSLDLDKRLRNGEGLKIRGYSAIKVIKDKSLAKINRKRKIYRTNIR